MQASEQSRTAQDFNSVRNQYLFGVFDGHGRAGHKASNFIASEVSEQPAWSRSARAPCTVVMPVGQRAHRAAPVGQRREHLGSWLLIVSCCRLRVRSVAS